MGATKQGERGEGEERERGEEGKVGRESNTKRGEEVRKREGGRGGGVTVSNRETGETLNGSPFAWWLPRRLPLQYACNVISSV